MAEPYQHQHFPKVVYFEDGSNRVVRSEDEFSQAKQDGARETPADFEKARSDSAKRVDAAAKAELDAKANAKKP